MKKIVPDLSTPESRQFWKAVENSAREVQSWPAWKRAGINVAPVRQETRESSPRSQPDSPSSGKR